MRILSLTTIYPNPQRAAEGRSVAFLDQALAKLGLEGTTLVLKPWAPYWLARRKGRWKHLAIRRGMEERNGVHIVFSQYVHIPPRYRLDLCAYLMAIEAIRLIKRHRFNFDILHGQSIYPSALAAHLVARHFKVPFVITLRDDLSHLSHLYEHRGARRLFEPMFASVSAIFVHGPALLRDVPAFLPPGASPPIILASNGVDFEGLKEIVDALPDPSERPRGEIVSVGNLYRIKGIHENLQALKLLNERGLKEWRYRIVGEGPYRKELETLSMELELKSQVTFAGRVTHSEALRSIKYSSLFSLPSWGEAFGNVYAEAAVCGRPSIGCRGGGAELTIRDGETGFLVSPKDVGDLAEALAFLLMNPERGREMGELAREHIRQFTWDGTAKLYQQTIRSVLS